MDRQTLIRFIDQLATLNNAFDLLEAECSTFSQQEVCNHLLECGVIPEVYAHDSSQEKLWAKYCDLLLKVSMTHLGIEAEVLRTRGDSADVFGKTTEYSIIADAKAFRLSRTAKNQKDFKVSALDDWRRGKTFACLVSPLYQYPRSNSQIYGQAIERNVTLLSYMHLRFLLEHKPQRSLSLLWEIGRRLVVTKNAQLYWDEVDKTVLVLTGQEQTALENSKHQSTEAAKALVLQPQIAPEERLSGGTS